MADFRKTGWLKAIGIANWLQCGLDNEAHGFGAEQLGRGQRGFGFGHEWTPEKCGDVKRWWSVGT